MSIPQNTLIGKTRRSIGNVTFSTWKGINVMKSKPITVANPRTDKQKMQRSAQAQLVALARQMPSAIKLGFNQLAIAMSAYNAFISYNIKNAFDFSAPPNAAIDYTRFLAAKGTIQPTLLTSSSINVAANNYVFAWSGSTLAVGQSANDRFVCVAIDQATNKVEVFDTGILRSVGAATCHSANDLTVNTSVTLYTFFVSEDGKKSETSTFVQFPI